MADPWMLAADYLRQWQAEPVGHPFLTASSVLAPATRDGEPVMLKIATSIEERRGNALMVWWAGRGAARVLEYDETAVLLERATGPRSLIDLAVGAANDNRPGADQGSDDDATRILCAAATRLHTIDDTPPPGLIPLETWFDGLFRHAESVDGFHVRAAALARELLAEHREPVVLHGDLHHGNVLDFGTERHPKTDGWLAIDPKYLSGDRAFDFTNILCNPNGEAATRPGRLSRQVDVVCEATGLERVRLLRWTIAWCGLSTAWLQQDAAEAGAPHPRTAGTLTLAIGAEAERLLDAEAGNPLAGRSERSPVG